MTHKICDILADRLSEAESVGTEVDTSSPYYEPGKLGSYSNVFYKYYTKAGGEHIACNLGFNRFFEIPASDGGFYPTRQDLNNLFHIGIDHGKLRSFGMAAKWDQTVSTMLDGYPFKSILYDDDGNRFISRLNNNKNPLPKAGETSNAWVPIKPIPSFMVKSNRSSPKWNRTDFNPSIIKLDVGLPLDITTTKMMVKKFTGADLGFSGILFFTDCLSMKWNYYQSIVNLDPPYVEENVVSKASFSIKLSLYPDIYDNEDHVDSFIEIFSKSKYYKRVPNKSLTWEYRSPHMMVPISLNTTYYLYMEFENACLADPWGWIRDGTSDYGIMTYRFPRTLCWPLDNP